MDMWDPYVASTREHLDESEKKIVYQISHRGVWRRRWTRSFTGPRRRAFDRHEVRLAAASGNFSNAWREFRRCAKAT